MPTRTPRPIPTRFNYLIKDAPALRSALIALGRECAAAVRALEYGYDQPTLFDEIK